MEAKSTKVEIIAKTCHTVNKVYCETLGDTSHLLWEEAPDNIKDSARAGVIAHLSDPLMTAEDSHRSWTTHKVQDGWVYGETKDAEKKTHPCLVDYKNLPKDQQTKDYLFKAVVDSLRDSMWDV